MEHRAADYADVAAMLGKCSLLADAGYRPYYMYRQKGTLQNLENIGWAKPGFECLYNIYIMEEVHTILSAGAGGSTKLVIPGQRRGKIERIFNFKYPTEYIDRFAELLDRKRLWRISMHVTHRKRFVSRDLVALAARRPQELAALSEAHYHDQIESIADEVLAAGQRIVMLTIRPPQARRRPRTRSLTLSPLAGTAARLSALTISTSGRKYPKHPDGSDDYESLEALDLERLHACLKALYKTGVCDAPVFDFTIQRPSGTQRIDARDGVVIIEGLHALNPALTEELPEDAALCLYAGLREEYADSRDARCLATRDIRLARRLVRDCLFRGHGAAFTLGLWGHVCAGEDRYIKPYKPRANLLLDTTHTYEVCLWRTVLDTMPADPALTATQARQLAALREKFAAFPALGTELVPQNSMLREFIGK
ncbi:hypothetical protein NIA69_13635 [Gemmiger formicilis]|nr:hypothetical protein [Gemmiger formicilis]